MPPYVYPKLAAARAKARELGLPVPHSSYKPAYKLYVTLDDGTEIHFGARGYSHFLQHRDPDRRRRYQQRHRGVLLGDGTPAYRNRRSPAYYSWYILW